MILLVKHADKYMGIIVKDNLYINTIYNIDDILNSKESLYSLCKIEGICTTIIKLIVEEPIIIRKNNINGYHKVILKQLLLFLSNNYKL